MVDWIGLDIFNDGALVENGFWVDFYTLTRTFYDAVKGYGKPIMIAEVGCSPSGGDKVNWYRDMFHYLAVNNFPAIKTLVLFDAPSSTAPNGLPVDLAFTTTNGVYDVIDKQLLIDSLSISRANSSKEDVCDQ